MRDANKMIRDAHRKHAEPLELRGPGGAYLEDQSHNYTRRRGSFGASSRLVRTALTVLAVLVVALYYWWAVTL